VNSPITPQPLLPTVAQRDVPPVLIEALQQRFGLTRGEARVVRRLAEGRSIKRIAEELRVSPETARTHAKRAMQKTNTHRQAELVSLVLQGD
jgi:DNA-binding CsgD family transcriptional regulator